jgi:hypothetical protein
MTPADRLSLFYNPTMLLRRCSMRATALAVLVASTACVRPRIDAAPADAAGHTAAALTVAGRAIALATCQSGDRAYFLGVDLADDAGGTVVRVAIDAVDGARLVVRTTLDGGPVRERLDGTRCPRLTATIAPTGWRVNHVRDVSGTIDAECTTTGGVPIAVHARFTHCH